MKAVLALLLTALALSACGLPRSDVHPNFGPHYGDGGAG
jgi:hypothetical protein